MIKPLILFNNCKIEDVYIGRTILISGGSQNPGYGGNPSTFFPTSLSTIIIGDYVKNIDAVLMNEQKITSSLSHYPNLETVQFGTNLTKLPSLIDNSMLTHLSTSSVTPPSANPFSNSQYMDLTVEIPEGSLDAYKSAPVWMNFWEFKERANLLHCIEFDEILYRILIDNEVEAIKKDSEYGGNIIIPSNFEYNNKTYNVISIGEAFKGCSTLSTISLPSSVGTLGSNCFADCIKLERVEIKGNLKEIPYGAFRNCTKLTHIQVPETVTRISGYAFSGCSALNEFTCYKAIESIEESAFEGCSSIASFSTNNVSSLGQSAFKNCVGLKHVELNNKIRVISSECFSGCANLETISNLQSITKIENNAFENCKLITDFVLPQIISISDYAFENCENASSFILGDDLEQLGNGVFYNCRSVESIIIPGNVNSIGSSVFSGCSALKDLSFNEGDAILELPVGYYDRETSVLKKEVNGKTIQFKIKYYKSVFDGLNIEKLFLGRNLSNAPRYTISGDGGVNYYLITSYDSPFNNLPMLKELQIGDNVNVLGPDEIYIPEVEMYETPGAFKNCNSLVKVSVKNTTPPSGVEFSNSTYSKATLIVPDNTVSLYKVANGWKEFLNILDESSTSIDGVSCNELSGNLSIGRNGLLYMGGSPEHILIYRIDGTLYYSGYIEPNQSISLDSGLYIIRLKENSIKIQI